MSASGIARLRFANEVEQDDQASRPPVEHPVVGAAEVAAQLPQLTPNLRRVREWQMRVVEREQVQAVDLRVNDRLVALRQKVDRVIDGLRPVSGSVVDGVERSHGVRTRIGSLIGASFGDQASALPDCQSPIGHRGA